MTYMDKPRLLVTRFAPHASRLADQLNAQGVFALAQPLLEIKKSIEFNNVCFLFTKRYDYIIAVSSNAVDYTEQALSDKKWPVSCYIAVGKTTQKKLQWVTKQHVSIPATDFTSEGVLQLPSLKDLVNKRVLILRGIGGRELLAQSLAERGAIVEYYQPYQRIALDLQGSRLVKQWQHQRINGAIISSVEILHRLFEVVPVRELKWLKTLVIYVPSVRIADQARKLGWEKVDVFPGIQDQQILDYFKKL